MFSWIGNLWFKELLAVVDHTAWLKVEKQLQLTQQAWYTEAHQDSKYHKQHRILVSLEPQERQNSLCNKASSGDHSLLGSV